MRVYTEQLTGDDTDVFAGTQLDTLQSGGQLDIWMLSSQADSIASLFGPGNEPVATSIEISNEARVPRPNDDTPFTLVIQKAGHYTLNVDIVTAATVYIVAAYREAGIDF